MSTTKFRARGGPVADASRARYDSGAMEEIVEKTGTSRVAGVSQVFDLHALKAFTPDKGVRKMLFKTDQVWSGIAGYASGQSTVTHRHPKEEEPTFVLQGTAHMSIDGEDVVVEAGSIVKFPRS